MKKNNVLYILCDGRAAAIDKKNGEIIWEIKLSQYHKGGLSFSIGQLMVEDDKLFIATSGVLLCLNAKDGSLLWKNPLKGWGYGFVSMADVKNEAAQAAMSQAAARAAGTT